MILGHHINTSHGFDTAADQAVKTGADVYQIFYRAPQSYNSFFRKAKDVKALAEKNKKYNKKMVIHGSYLINLCQDPSDKRHYLGVNILVEDLDESVKLNAMGVIIHMGNDTKDLLGIEKSKENYIKGVKEALRRSDSKSTLILETGCGSGSEVSSSLEELGQIRKALTSSEQKRVKFCLDTCHMFAAGCRLDIEEGVDVVEMDVERYLGWENVVVVHLNDSEDQFFSKKDNHADIGKGKIGIDGLMRFVKCCVERNIPMVLETPTHYYNDIRYNHARQMNTVRVHYTIAYDNLGGKVKIVSRTKTKKELRDRIAQEK